VITDNHNDQLLHRTGKEGRMEAGHSTHTVEERFRSNYAKKSAKRSEKLQNIQFMWKDS
jgi:hypothetical protein